MNLFKRTINSLNPRVFITIGVIAAGLTLCIAGFLIVRDFIEDKNINKVEKTKMAYNLEQLDENIASRTRSNLLYFEDLEPLFLNPELYRETELPWTLDDVREFWIPADRSDIDYFINANHDLIWDILKDSP